MNAHPKSLGPRLPSTLAWTVFNLILLCVSLVCLAASVRFSIDNYSTKNWALKQVSMASPVLDCVQVDVERRAGNTTLLLGDSPSIYRQDPSPAVDIAWAKLGDTRLIPLTADEVLAIGKDPKKVVKFPESFGLGSNAYAGRLDIFHQIHCLDALRREAYFEHYYGSGFPGGYNQTDKMHRLHLSHCVEYLLQSLLCQATTDIYTHMWTDAVEHPFPDFSVEHKCRNFGALKDWHDKNAVDVNNFVDLKAPEGAKVHQMSREFKEVHGWFKGHEDTGMHGDEIA